MTARFRTCDRAYAEYRLEQALLWHDRARGIDPLLASGPARSLAVSDAALAGIAASDSICCKTLGKCSTGQNHNEAVAFLKSVPHVGKDAATHLAKLVKTKDRAQYRTHPPKPKQVKGYIRAMQRLVDTAQELLGGE